jgi:hypothetical protein
MAAPREKLSADPLQQLFMLFLCLVKTACLGSQIAEWCWSCALEGFTFAPELRNWHSKVKIRTIKISKTVSQPVDRDLLAPFTQPSVTGAYPRQTWAKTAFWTLRNCFLGAEAEKQIDFTSGRGHVARHRPKHGSPIKHSKYQN